MLKTRKVSKPDIPTSSMGDITFLMLIFFLVSTVFNNEMGLQIVLPEDSKEEVKVKTKNIVKVRIDKFGNVKMTYTLNDNETTEPMDWNTVGDKTTQLLDSKNGKKLIFAIIPTRSAKYEYMIRVFDQLKIGFRKAKQKERISLSPAEDDEG